MHHEISQSPYNVHFHLLKLQNQDSNTHSTELEFLALEKIFLWNLKSKHLGQLVYHNIKLCEIKTSAIDFCGHFNEIKPNRCHCYLFRIRMERQKAYYQRNQTSTFYTALEKGHIYISHRNEIGYCFIFTRS